MIVVGNALFLAKIVFGNVWAMFVLIKGSGKNNFDRNVSS
jgi:hypothetical protein